MTASDDVAIKLGARVDDELIITVRVRLTRTEAADLARLNNDALPDALGKVYSATADLPGQATGAELTLPSFEPYPDAP